MHLRKAVRDDMIPGIQTHIEGWTDPVELTFVAAQRFVLARIAAMECADAVVQECVHDAQAAGLRPFITIADPARMRLFPGLDYECRNEDDGDISPRMYRLILDDMAEVARETGSRLWGPTCSNTNRKCVRWAREVRGSGWPEGMHGLSWHSYDPQENREFDAVEALADGRPIVYSEFGYPSLGISDEAQAARIRDLWAFYESRGAAGAILFQIHDGPSQTEREHHYGILRFDRTWKPAAFTVPNMGMIVPTPKQEPDVIADPMISRSQLMPVASRPGYFTARYPRDSTTTVLSIQPNGDWHTRPIGTEGPWEVCRIEGTRLVFPETETVTRGIALGD